METFYLQIGIFCIALVMTLYFKVHKDRHKYMDNFLFRRLLISAAAVLAVDTFGWLLEGKPLYGQIWITQVVDAFDLFLTSAVCWNWVQYARYIAKGENALETKWYMNITNWLLGLQFCLVVLSQHLGIYFYIDEAGFYHRTTGYFMHTAISVGMLLYSSFICAVAYDKTNDPSYKKELIYVAFVIFIPFLGNIFQYYIYGFPTVWLCMTFMILGVYIHIQEKRISEERQAQNAVLEKALLEAQKADAAKTEFFSLLSHDMRTPMNGILGMVELSQGEDNPKILQDNIEKIKNSGEYLLGLINDTLDFQKIESGKLELDYQPVSVKSLEDDVIGLIKRTADEKGVVFVTDLTAVEPDWYIKADSLRIRQIFLNLLSNAIKFTPKGGIVSLRMELVNRDESCTTERIIVEDSGVGMSPAFLANGIFKPFSQERNQYTAQYAGSGLGLSIVKRLVELMGGTIEVESTVGVGTKFIVTLRFERLDKGAHNQTVDDKTKRQEDAMVLLSGKHILLAEDHPLNAEIAKKLLEKAGCTVNWAKNGEECLEVFKKSTEGTFDVILMDIRMPLMDGIEATKELRALAREDAKTVPVIALTANAYSSDVKNCMAAGMNGHIAKPIVPLVMYETIAKMFV